MKPNLESSVVKAALAAGEILSRSFKNRTKKGFRIEEKGFRGDQGLVTEADLKAEEKISKILMRAHPEMGILAEEGTQARQSHGAPGRFIIDPLDGTTNFVHGFPFFCVSIAAEVGGVLQAGAIYAPLLGDLYVASRGKGARIGKTKLKVSQTRKIQDSLLTTGFSYRRPGLLTQEMRTFHELSLNARAIRRPGSAALDLAYVARGIFDGFWERGLSPWDVAAGILLVREAGGKVTDFNDGKSPMDRGEVLAANPFLHSELLKQIRSSN